MSICIGLVPHMPLCNGLLPQATLKKVKQKVIKSHTRENNTIKRHSKLKMCESVTGVTQHGAFQETHMRKKAF